MMCYIYLKAVQYKNDKDVFLNKNRIRLVYVPYINGILNSFRFHFIKPEAKLKFKTLIVPEIQFP